MTIGAAKAAQTNRRWDREEIAGMTCEEARLCRNGVASRNFNSLLVAFIPDRTREAIKGQRRHQDYISLVKSYMPEMDGVVVPQRDITHRPPPHIANATAQEFSACVVNWRGTPSNRSMRELENPGVTKRDWHTLSVKVLEGGVKTISAFKWSTSTWRGSRL